MNWRNQPTLEEFIAEVDQLVADIISDYDNPLTPDEPDGYVMRIPTDADYLDWLARNPDAE